MHIETGIPIPMAHTGRGNKSAARVMIETLPVGSSLLVPYEDNAKKASNRLRAIASKLKPRKFCTRTTTTGIRIWRIE